MFKPSSLIPGKEIEDPGEDFRTAQRVEQYRIGAQALYLPEGLRWNYIPLSEIRQAGASHRTISAGHCVTVREQRPAADLETSAGPMTLTLDRPESLQKLLAALQPKL